MNLRSWRFGGKRRFWSWTAFGQKRRTAGTRGLGGETGKEETEGVGDAKFLGSADRGTEGGRAGEVGRTGTAEWGQERAERELIREDSKESFDSIVLSRD